MSTLFPAVILAGGLATRLRPLTETIPKSMVLINGEPFIDHQLRLLHSQGVRDVVLCVGYLGEMIEQHVGDGRSFDIRIQYSYDGQRLLGTGGAIKQALPFLDEHFFVVYGDSYLPCEYAAVQSAYLKANKLGLMTVFKNNGLWDNSNIEYAEGNILAYDKKQRTKRMDYIDFGLGVFSREAFSSLSEKEPYDLADLYQLLLKSAQLSAYEVSNRFYEIGSFAGMKELEYYLTGESAN